MMRYEEFLQLRQLMDVEKCSANRIAEVMNLNIKTVLVWADRGDGFRCFLVFHGCRPFMFAIVISICPESKRDSNRMRVRRKQ